MNNNQTSLTLMVAFLESEGTEELEFTLNALLDFSEECPNIPPIYSRSIWKKVFTDTRRILRNDPNWPEIVAKMRHDIHHKYQ